MKIMNQYMFTFVKVILVQMQLKYGLLKVGECILANNNSRIPEHDLRKIYKSIRYNFFFIVNKWKQRFKDCEIKFYC